ncbi:DUF438 domain-containing protein [candidate division KSB1 bacterium]|nr:DUF438 domain-containing protein [candidate division KSB1 bacterium]
MSELINNSEQRKKILKHMILQLHEGVAPEDVKRQLVRLLKQIPYNDVVEVEQQLISEGLPQEEVLKLCDVHSAALKGTLDLSDAKTPPKGHPVHTMQMENRAIEREVKTLNELYEQAELLADDNTAVELFYQIRFHFNNLMDVEKHYMRKENLLFPFLEQHGVTGPSSVMWGKHDEAREKLKAAQEALVASETIAKDEASSVIELVLKPASDAVVEMIFKEEEILFPMSMDKLTDAEWYQIATQSDELGYCLYDPIEKWQPHDVEPVETATTETGRIKLPSGSMTPIELNAILNSIPFDMTFVDADDRVRYFTQGRERIFARSRAIIGRKVQQCHPPKSVHTVEKILDDFKSGAQSSAAFWINMAGKFIHIEYFALHDDQGNYLGTLEVSQDLTGKRALQGEQRLLSYE